MYKSDPSGFPVHPYLRRWCEPDHNQCQALPTIKLFSWNAGGLTSGIFQEHRAHVMPKTFSYRKLGPDCMSLWCLPNERSAM